MVQRSYKAKNPDVSQYNAMKHIKMQRNETPHKNDIQCGAAITRSIFSKIIAKDTP